MAHKTLIEATGYEVQAGKTLIEGTAYTQKKGRALVNGTGYAGAFSDPVSLKVWGPYNSSRCYFAVDGIKIEVMGGLYGSGSSPMEMEIQNNQSLSVYVGGIAGSSDFINVKLNGTIVQYGSGTYEIDITACSSVTIHFYAQNTNFRCEITTA